MKPLSPRQRETLDQIRMLLADKGYPPTVREIGARLGIRSTNGVNDHLLALEQKGYIRRDPKVARGIVIL